MTMNTAAGTSEVLMSRVGVPNSDDQCADLPITDTGLIGAFIWADTTQVYGVEMIFESAPTAPTVIG